jgi:hypothetical protein
MHLHGAPSSASWTIHLGVLQGVDKIVPATFTSPVVRRGRKIFRAPQAADKIDQMTTLVKRPPTPLDESCSRIKKQIMIGQIQNSASVLPDFEQLLRTGIDQFEAWCTVSAPWVDAACPLATLRQIHSIS